MPEPIVTLNEESLKSDLRELVRKTVEDTLNGLLDEEAGDLVGAERYERAAGREAYRAGHYDRSLATTSGEVTLRMPKLKGMRFTTAIIEPLPAPRDQRRGGDDRDVPGRRLDAQDRGRLRDPVGVERVGGDVSNLNEKAFAAVEEWRNRPLVRAYPYVYVDGIYLKRSWGGSYENVAVMVAIGVNDDGYREVIGAAEGFTESAECWREFLSWLKSRGLRGVRMFTGDKAAGMVRLDRRGLPERRLPALHGPFLPQRAGEGAQVQEAQGGRDAQGHTRMESREASEAKAPRGGRRARLNEAEGGREGRRDGYAETLTYTRFPREHWRRIRTNNAIERLNREIRRRTRVVGTFPDGKSALMLVTARLKYVAESEWGSRRYLDVTLLEG